MRQYVAPPSGVQHIVWYKYNTPHLAATKCRSPFGAQHIVYNYKLYATYSRCDKMSQHFFRPASPGSRGRTQNGSQTRQDSTPHTPFFLKGSQNLSLYTLIYSVNRAKNLFTFIKNAKNFLKILYEFK